ncbi:hypothetical protein [Nonomuraea salmonea]|uniref:hypothetical protein n=1 Tax=Nonomuraea salmonea TaxID=46181 RepID=UPI002FEA4DA5
MLHIGTWKPAVSPVPPAGAPADVVVCGWHDGGPPPCATRVKIIYALDGPVPEFPGLLVGRPVARGAEEIAELLLQGGRRGAHRAGRFSGGRYRTPEVTVPLESVRLSQEAPSRIGIALHAEAAP